MIKCEYCAKTFDENWILQRHKREVHEWESQFQCGKCEKKFKENITLSVMKKLAVVAKDVTHNLTRSRKKRTMHANHLEKFEL